MSEKTKAFWLSEDPDELVFLAICDEYDANFQAGNPTRLDHEIHCALQSWPTPIKKRSNNKTAYTDLVSSPSWKFAESLELINQVEIDVPDFSLLTQYGDLSRLKQIFFSPSSIKSDNILLNKSVVGLNSVTNIVLNDEKIGLGLKKNKNLKNINFSYIDIDNTKLFMNILKNAPQLRAVGIPQGAVSVLLGTKSLVKTQEIHLDSPNIEDLDAVFRSTLAHQVRRIQVVGDNETEWFARGLAPKSTISCITLESSYENTHIEISGIFDKLDCVKKVSIEGAHCGNWSEVQNWPCDSVRWFCLAQCGFGDSTFQTMANQPFSRLRALEVPANGLTASGLQEVLKSPWFANLREFNISGNPIGDSGVELLAQSRHARNLKTLWIDGCEITEQGLRALANSPWINNLEKLSIGGNRVLGQGFKNLLESGKLKKLKYLNLTSCDLGDEGVSLFTGNSVVLEKIIYLCLQFNKVTSEGLKIISQGKNFPCLLKLDLSWNKLGDQGAKILSESPWLRSLLDCRLTPNARM